MKRIMIVIVSGVLLCLFTQTCFAESAQSDVYAKYKSNDQYFGMFALENGSATASIVGKITISVNGLPFDNAFLYVKMISEIDKEALLWLKSCLSSQSDSIIPLEICIKDQFGRTYSIPSEIPITISAQNLNDVRVFHMNGNGVCKEISCSVDSNGISFKTALNGYIVLTQTSASMLSPQTGDDRHILLWTIAMIISSSMTIVFLLMNIKHKNHG